MLVFSLAAWTIASDASAANLQSASSTTFVIPSGTFETPALPTFPAPVLLSSGPHLVELAGLNPLGTDNTAFIDDFRAVRLSQLAIDGFESPALPASPGRGSSFIHSPRRCTCTHL
jgi:hypothetical protein